MDYPGQSFAKLKYSDSCFSNSWSGQSHLNHTLISQVLDCAQKLSVSELEIQLVQYQSTVSCLQVTKAISSLRDTYTYIPSEIFSTAEYSGAGHVQWRCILTSHLYAIPVSPHSLVKRTTNPYGTQWPPLDITIVLLIAYHLVANMFKD